MGTAGLHARLLGAMDLRFGGRQVPPLGSARAESLLAYLLAAPRRAEGRYDE